MCHKGTRRLSSRLWLLGLAVALVAPAQNRPDWRKVGSSSVELMLASPATGPMQYAWFSADGARLYAATASGRVFQTDDFETWTPAVAPLPDPPQLTPATAARLPEPSARIFRVATDPGRVYALGQQLLRSGDAGHSWENLTAFKASSVIGPGQNYVAVSQSGSDQVVVANNYGVWRSLDGGLTWAGLNRFLPNLPVERIVSTPDGIHGARIQLDGGSVLELPPGGSTWAPVANAPQDSEDALRARYSAVVRTEVTASGGAGTVVYAGTSDGRLFASVDGGQTFPQWSRASGGRVERIFVDAAEPWVALAAIGGSGPHLLRTINLGVSWDPLDGNLPAVPVHAVTAELASGAVYVATDRGVFYAQTDLEHSSPVPPNWVSLTDELRLDVPARDVRLDAAGAQLYIALDGYGLYAALAPHRLRSLRIVNAADYSTRAAAPGSLLSVIGGRVSSAAGGSLNYPVLRASDSESQIQVPFEEAAGVVALALQTADGRTTVRLAVQAVSPAILVGRDGVPALADADSGMTLDPRNPAHSGGHVEVMATGLGRVQPDWPTGMPARQDSPPAVTATVRAFLNGAPIEVTRATLAPGYIGFYLVEVRLPAFTNVGASDLHLTADGRESNHVQIVIEP